MPGRPQNAASGSISLTFMTLAEKFNRIRWLYADLYDLIQNGNNWGRMLFDRIRSASAINLRLDAVFR
jgi:hypothetical protein